MEIREREDGTATVFELSGRLTVSDRPGLLREAVSEAVNRGARRVVLDLSGVRYIDSTRLGELIAAHVSVARQEGALRLAGVPERVVELLTMAGLKDVFALYPTVSDAIRSMPADDDRV